ncbi:hypothetical protein PhCBS80983_g02953 [Powellomyces hirtus]|uniref:GDT1 family protein n=1 Tax=Powellomyces hirtus TaxID=109895 RepID=A0A507E4F7_9FUNG|nr:hypothetical protein PhCBS80983_g02953 [Powellomyces hirtus]
MSFSVILLSEIGDKTFFIAAILAMKNPRLLVFSSAISALALMTVLSAFLGHIAPLFISKKYTQLCAAILFIVFGVRMLWDGRKMTGKECQDELREVAAELDEKEEAEELEDMEGGEKPGTVPQTSGRLERSWKKLGDITRAVFGRITSPVWVEGFVLTFLAEWGDRSQIATVALAGAEDFWWVTIGSLAGHSICTAVAVIGGRMLASKISVKTSKWTSAAFENDFDPTTCSSRMSFPLLVVAVTILGGILFIAFGIVAFKEAFGFHASIPSFWRD